MGAAYFHGVGRLTRDPEVRHTPNGNSVTTFAIAVNSGFGEHERVSYFEIEVWGKQGDSCAQYLQKGRQVFVTGEIRQDRWETAEGEKRSKHKITAIPAGVQFLGGGNGNGNAEGSSEAAPAAAAAAPSSGDDDIPF